MVLAILLDAFDMAEKIEAPRLFPGDGPKHAAPDASGIASTYRFPVLVGFHQLEADGAHVGAEVERFDIEEVHYPVPSSSVAGN
jgi:hypothetical protein